MSHVGQELLTLLEHLETEPNLIAMFISYSFQKCMLFVVQQYMQEEFEDTKGAIRIRTSKKNRQHNGQKKKYKRINNDQKTLSGPFLVRDLSTGLYLD
jgi:hypothetical protein